MRHARRNEPTGVERTVAASEMLGEVPYCLTTESLWGVVSLMQSKNCNTVAVVNNERERQPVGVIDAEDISRTRSANGSDAMKQSVDGCMSTPIVAVFLDTLAAECIDAMALNSLDYVVVIDRQGRLQGAMTRTPNASSSERLGGRPLA